tara:strand:- start:346 stop:498 length:153 start_codon:yes stop_codon:yes gene_type:complete
VYEYRYNELLGILNPIPTLDAPDCAVVTYPAAVPEEQVDADVQISRVFQE